MNELKFRAWDSEFKSYVEPITYFVGFDGSAWFNNCGDGEDAMYDQSEKLTVEQCTGLKDKNGKEIYEGDIVKGVSSPDKDPERFAFVGEVKWDLEDTGFFYESTNDKWPHIKPWFALEVEIIGNIHENPEKLNE